MWERVGSSGRNNPILALPLRLIHRRIGACKESVEGFVFCGLVAQALTDGDTKALAVMAEIQPLNLPLQALSHEQGHVRRTAGEHCRKFLPANPAKQITPAQRRT